MSEVRKSYLLVRKLLIKTFGSSNSPRLEIEKIRNVIFGPLGVFLMSPKS